MTVLRVPPVSISMQEVKVIRWLVADGASVQMGTKLVEVETDKALVEIDSPSEGVVHIRVGEQCVVDSDAELAEILPAGQPPLMSALQTRYKPRIRTKATIATPTSPRAAGSPAARRLAREHGIDLNNVNGSGPEGRVVTADVEQLIATKGDGLS